MKKNQDQRSKHPDDPSKYVVYVGNPSLSSQSVIPHRFIDSEADLDIAIKGLLPLAQVPSIAYPEIVKSGVAEVLVGLLSHENADIVIDVVELIHELTDEDVGDEGAEDEEEDQEEQAPPLKLLIESLVRKAGRSHIGVALIPFCSKHTRF